MSEIIFANHWISSSLTTLLDKSKHCEVGFSASALHWDGMDGQVVRTQMLKARRAVAVGSFPPVPKALELRYLTPEGAGKGPLQCVRAWWLISKLGLQQVSFWSTRTCEWKTSPATRLMGKVHSYYDDVGKSKGRPMTTVRSLGSGVSDRPLLSQGELYMRAVPISFFLET